MQLTDYCGQVMLGVERHTATQHLLAGIAGRLLGIVRYLLHRSNVHSTTLIRTYRRVS